jgi:glucose/arabinose dehydrogenase
MVSLENNYFIMNKYISVVLLTVLFPLFLQSEQYMYETVITGLDSPVEFAFLPNNNVIITQKAGRAVIYNMTSGQLVSTFWNFTDSTLVYYETGLLGVCIDPNYNVNHFIYFYYTNTNPDSYRVVRLTENNNLGTYPEIILAIDTTIHGIHAGGNLRFGKDNKLYISRGDYAEINNAQRLTNPHGKILRINSDGTIPADNPFYDDGNPRTGNDDRIWAYGLKNTFDFCFSPINDSIYATENGVTRNDELNFIRKGGNYGYPYCVGYCNPYNPLYRQPMAVFDCCFPGAGSTITTGVIVYNGNQMPELYGKAIVAGFAQLPQGGMYICSLGNAPFYDTVSQKTMVIESQNVSGLVQGNDGFIYAARLIAAPNGKIQRLKHDPTGINNNNLPVTFSLSQNYPNPFNPTTSIKYEIPKNSLLSLKVYNVLGVEVASLVNETKQQGSHEVSWDATIFPSGVYFYELNAGNFKERKKMVLIK